MNNSDFKWISVEERLPEDDTKVTTTNKWRNQRWHRKCLHCANLCAPDLRDKMWCNAKCTFKHWDWPRPFCALYKEREQKVLKAVEKEFLIRVKKTEKNPTGYKLIHEPIDGVEISQSKEQPKQPENVEIVNRGDE
jgi:hypothetical protein